MKASSLHAIILALSVFSIGAQAQELPLQQASSTSQANGETAAFKERAMPPSGFAWQGFKNVTILHPDGWFEHTMESGHKIPMHVLAMSPEQFSREGHFETGFTIQIIENPQKFGNIDAYKAVLLYLKPFIDSHRTPGDTLMLEQSQRGERQLTFYRYRDAPAGQKPVIVHKYIVASRQFDSVHVFTFESPEVSWTENWKNYGTPILKMLALAINMPISKN
jgi:hypothetical protein